MAGTPFTTKIGDYDVEVTAVRATTGFGYNFEIRYRAWGPADTFINLTPTGATYYKGALDEALGWATHYTLTSQELKDKWNYNGSIDQLRRELTAKAMNPGGSSISPTGSVDIPLLNGVKVKSEGGALTFTNSSLRGITGAFAKFDGKYYLDNDPEAFNRLDDRLKNEVIRRFNEAESGGLAAKYAGLNFAPGYGHVMPGSGSGGVSDLTWSASTTGLIALRDAAGTQYYKDGSNIVEYNPSTKHMMVLDATMDAVKIAALERGFKRAENERKADQNLTSGNAPIQARLDAVDLNNPVSTSVNGFDGVYNYKDLGAGTTAKNMLVLDTSRMSAGTRMPPGVTRGNVYRMVDGQVRSVTNISDGSPGFAVLDPREAKSVEAIFRNYQAAEQIAKNNENFETSTKTIDPKLTGKLLSKDEIRTYQGSDGVPPVTDINLVRPLVTAGGVNYGSTFRDLGNGEYLSGKPRGSGTSRTIDWSPVVGDEAKAAIKAAIDSDKAQIKIADIIIKRTKIDLITASNGDVEHYTTPSGDTLTSLKLTKGPLADPRNPANPPLYPKDTKFYKVSDGNGGDTYIVERTPIDYEAVPDSKRDAVAEAYKIATGSLEVQDKANRAFREDGDPAGAAHHSSACQQFNGRCQWHVQDGG